LIPYYFLLLLSLASLEGSVKEEEEEKEEINKTQQNFLTRIKTRVSLV
jgi:hypothetical protein